MIKAIQHSLMGFVKMAKSFLLYDEGEAVAVDAGHSRRCAKRIVGALREIGLSVEDLRMCILTHRHWDHAGGAAALKKVAGCEVAIHSEDAEAMGYIIDRSLEDGELIPLCGGIRVIQLPGHTAGSVCLLYEEALISGDTLIGGRRGLKPPASIYCEDYEEALRSLGRLRELDFEAIYVSHGWDVTSGGKRALLELLRHLGSTS